MEKDTLISTNRLFHYTYSKDNLISILKNGFRPKYSLEKLEIIKRDAFIDFISKQSGKTIKEEEISDEFAIPMCCFCDIPLNLVENHIKIYGEYSIGLKKEWGERNAICPVMYVPQDGDTRFLLELMIRYTHRLIPKINEKYDHIKTIPFDIRDTKDEFLTMDIITYLDNVINLIMYVKPYKGLYERKYLNFRDDNYKFYDEREWRYKPNRFLIREFLYKEEFDDKNILESYNVKMGYITFDNEDITDIIVPDNEVQKFKKLITTIKGFENFDISKIDSIKNKNK